VRATAPDRQLECPSGRGGGATSRRARVRRGRGQATIPRPEDAGDAGGPPPAPDACTGAACHGASGRDKKARVFASVGHRFWPIRDRRQPATGFSRACAWHGPCSSSARVLEETAHAGEHRRRGPFAFSVLIREEPWATQAVDLDRSPRGARSTAGTSCRTGRDQYLLNRNEPPDLPGGSGRRTPRLRERHGDAGNATGQVTTVTTGRTRSRNPASGQTAVWERPRRSSPRT
jgi:hypothetical protein